MGSKLGKQKFSSDPNLTIDLSEHEIELLLKSTAMTREQIIDFHKNFLNDCPNGYLTKKEFVGMFKELHKNDEIIQQKCEKFCEYVFNAFDGESKNKISFKDFLVCFSITSFGNLREKIELAFNIYDLDKNKVIDRSELTKVIEALYDMAGVPTNERQGEKAPKTKVDEMISKLDKNQNNVLEFDEFFDGCWKDEDVRRILIDPLFNC